MDWNAVLEPLTTLAVAGVGFAASGYRERQRRAAEAVEREKEREHADKVRREQWERDDAARRYQDLVSAYAATFSTLVRVERHSSRWSHPAWQDARESPELVKAAKELDEQRIRLSVLAPIDTLAAFDDVVAGLETTLEGIVSGRYDMLDEGTRALGEDIPRFTALARRDIGHGDVNVRPSA